MSKTAVLVVDMQKQFTEEGRRFFYPETTGVMMETFADKINRMRELGALIVVIYTKHDLTRMFVNGKKVALVDGSEDSELDDRIPYDPEKDILWRKYVPSAFFGTDLDRVLRERGIENVLVCGVKTNVCCRATATDAYSHKFRTYMISDMLGTNTREINEFHLAEMTKYFAKAIDSDEVIRRLESGEF